MKKLLNLLKHWTKRRNRAAVYLCAFENKVVIASGNDRVIMSPDFARTLASELSAFATIADKFSSPEQVQV